MQGSEFPELILHAFSLDDLKKLCREHNLKGYSRFKKAELVPFLKTSLAEEELEKILSIQGQQVLEKTVDLAVAIATGKEIREKLREITDTDGLITLDFKGLQWTQTTTIKDPSEGDVLPLWKCTCRTAQDGGICTHFYIGAISLHQLHGWRLASLPQILWLSKNEKKFADFQAKAFIRASGTRTTSYTTPEEILRGFFLDYGGNDTAAMERRAKGELITFAKKNAPDLEFDPKWTKARIISELVTKFGALELEVKFRKNRQDQKFEQAQEYLVDIKDLQWEPEQMVMANLQRMESHDITIEGTKVKHDCDGWRNIRPKFCTHLLALYLELSHRDPARTLVWLKKLAKS
ncbi:MAG: hypothetical protein RBG13Loki_2460 [Promethearchaeota archaeon CR_4]|nr:MAG: hypothetical protein RBG13Loki_2460 [Candidatus Lokiarchaeota archaeon CR_4]